MQHSPSHDASLRRFYAPFVYLIYFFTPHSRLKFTREGIWFFFMTVAVGIAALNTGIGLLYLILAMMLSFIIVSGILSELSLMMLEVKRVLPEKVHSGQTFSVTFRVHNRKRYFPSFSLSILDKSRAWEGGIGPEGYLLKVPAGGAAEVICRGMIPKRGLHSMDKVLFKTEYPFGLFIKEADYRCNQKLLVYPALGSILDGTILQPSRGRSLSLYPDKTAYELEEFHSLREYRRGDNPKWIHWRSSARMNRLMLREFETRTGKEALIYLDLCSSNDDGHGIEAAVEQAIGFTATLVKELHKRGYVVTLAGEGLRPTLQSSYPGENGVAHLFRSLALGEVVQGRFQPPKGEQERMLSRPGYKVLVSVSVDGNEALSRLGEGFRVIRVSHPSFYSLYSPPVLEANSK